MKNSKIRLPGVVLFATMVACGLAGSQARSDSYVIYVAPRDTPAAAAATAKANGNTAFAERTLQRAFNKAGELLAKGSHQATILIAGGNYTGQAGVGMFNVPQIKNPQASLRIIGGLSEDFTGRQPFKNLTRLQTNEGRNEAIVQFARQSQLKQIVISGLLLDAAPSNKYDSRTNSILPGTSRTLPLLALAGPQTEHLVVADNIFINGAHGAFDPNIVPASPNTVVDITNNFFINTIKAIQVGAGMAYRGNTVKEVNLRHNTFLVNWPLNPDTTSSNISAVNLYHSGAAQKLNIENNIFAHNPGGAMQHDWPANRMPKIALRNNLFFMNAALFGAGKADAGAMAGKFGPNAKHMILSLDTIADDFDYELAGNVAFDPKIPVMLHAIKGVDSAAVQRQNTLINDVRRIFRQNQDGGTVAIANFAPAMEYSLEALPLPTEAKAQPYGVQPNRLWTLN